MERIRPGIYDESGRYLAPVATVYADRPMGPWDSNVGQDLLTGAVLTVVCAWCPGFDPTDATVSANITHGICPICVAKMEASL